MSVLVVHFFLCHLPSFLLTLCQLGITSNGFLRLHKERQPNRDDRAQLLLHHLIDKACVKDKPIHPVFLNSNFDLIQDNLKPFTRCQLLSFDQDCSISDTIQVVIITRCIVLIFIELNFLIAPLELAILTFLIIPLDFSVLDHENADR